MNDKINVGILFGGKSVEHEVSVRSARNVYDAINKDKYNVVMIGITKNGKWLLEPDDGKGFIADGDGDELAIIPGAGGSQLMVMNGKKTVPELNVIFPILHGPYGEDGTMQGLLKLLDIPFVGPGVLGSAAGMDKEVMKKLLKFSNLPMADYIVLEKYSDEPALSYEEIAARLGEPFFIKPSSSGSSVGVHKVKGPDEFEKAVIDAFQFDHKLIVERNIKGREIECAVLGNDKPQASLPGEVRSTHSFYSYEAKYLDENGAKMDIPAKLPADVIEKIRDTAVKTYKAMYCEGLTRVDFFLTDDQELVINEINTLPGFTNISMYPKLWEVTGLSYTELIDRLIQLAIDRHTRESELKTSI